MNKILPKDLVQKWVNEVMTQSYDITIHPQEYPFGEKFIRSLQKEDWDVAIIEDHKIVVSSNDPLKLASLAIKLKRMGYLIED
tara:strand:- start:299 stop:547 length:249 start_codon:yes stop_codon:yes gene_type:complete